MLSSKHKALFYGKLALLLESGLSPIEAFGALSQHSQGGFGKAAAHIQKDLTARRDLLNSLREHTNLFSPFELGVFQAAIETGQFGSHLRLLESWFHRNQSFRREIKKHFALPVIYLILAYLVLRVKILFFLGPGPFLFEVILPLIVVGGGLVVLTTVINKRWGTHFWEEKLFPLLPFLRKPLQRLVISRFLWIYGNLLDAGLDQQRALELAAFTIAQNSIRKSVATIATKIDRGKTLTDSFTDSALFPPEVVHFVRTGEESGNLPEMLTKAAQMIEDEAEHKLKELIKVMGLLFYLLVIVYIAFTIFSFYRGYFAQLDQLV